MAEVRLTVKDVDDSNRRAKFTAAVQSLSKAMRIPLTIRPKETRKQEAFGFKAEEELVAYWNTYMGHTLDAVYRTVCASLGLPLIETFTKAIGVQDSGLGRPVSEAIIYRGKVIFNPETGLPIYREDFEKIIRAIEKFLNRRLDPAKRRIVLDAVSLGRVMARKLLTLPSDEVRKLRLDAVEYKGKTVPWMADDLDRQDKLFGPARPEERARMKAHYDRVAAAVDIAEESMGDHITRMEEEAVHAVRRSIIDGIKGRQSKTEIAQNLFNKFGNLNRDWQRISETETVDTFNNAMLRETVAVAEPGEKVYFRRVEMRDKFVCDYCDKIRGNVALWVDQPMTSEDIDDPVAGVAIWEGKSNVGRKKADYWVPAGTVHPWCYSDDTEVLTDSGWMLFKNLVGGEKIMSINPETREIGYVGYTKKIEYQYKGEMIHFDGLNYDKLVTPDHQVLFTTPKLWKSKRLISERAKDVIRRSQYFLPMAIGEWKGVVPKKTIQIQGREIEFRDYLRLWAWFLTEGSTRRREVKIAQKYPDKIIRDLPSFEPFFKQAKESVYLYGDISKIFKSYSGVHAEQKYIPDFIKKMSPEYIRYFLEAFRLGDGSYREGSHHKNSFQGNSKEITLRTSSPRMMSDLCELIVKAGWIPSVWMLEQKGQLHSFENGDYELKTNCYNINIKKSKFRHYCREPKICRNGKESYVPVIVPYDGMVYDVELEKWHFLLVKRNGKVAWSGNCRGSWERYFPPIKSK